MLELKRALCNHHREDWARQEPSPDVKSAGRFWQGADLCGSVSPRLFMSCGSCYHLNKLPWIEFLKLTNVSGHKCARSLPGLGSGHWQDLVSLGGSRGECLLSLLISRGHLHSLASAPFGVKVRGIVSSNLSASAVMLPSLTPVRLHPRNKALLRFHWMIHDSLPQFKLSHSCEVPFAI